MKRLTRFVLLASLVLVPLLAALASADYPTTPKGVMERYLQLDAEAAGLSEKTWPEIGQYTTFPVAPKWSDFVVIERYSIGKIMEGHSRAQVQVTYQPLGKLSATFVQDSKPEVVVFFLNKVQNQWKVDSPPLIPHVLWDVMKKRLEMANTANPKGKKANDALSAQIEASRGH